MSIFFLLSLSFGLSLILLGWIYKSASLFLLGCMIALPASVIFFLYPYPIKTLGLSLFIPLIFGYRSSRFSQSMKQYFGLELIVYCAMIATFLYFY